MSKSEAFEYCKDNCGQSSLFTTNSTSNLQWGNELLSYNDFLTKLDQQNNLVMYVYKDNTITTASGTVFHINFYDTFNINGNSWTASLNTERYQYTKNNFANKDKYFDCKNGTQSGSNIRSSFPTGNSLYFYMVFINGEIVQASFKLPPTRVTIYNK